jgi:hypothetical protein
MLTFLSRLSESFWKMSWFRCPVFWSIQIIWHLWQGPRTWKMRRDKTDQTLTCVMEEPHRYVQLPNSESGPSPSACWESSVYVCQLKDQHFGVCREKVDDNLDSSQGMQGNLRKEETGRKNWKKRNCQRASTGPSERSFRCHVHWPATSPVWI